MENTKIIEKLEDIKKRIDLVDTHKLEADFSDPAAAMKGYALRIINAEIAKLEGRIPDPDDLLVEEIENMMKES